MPERNNRYRNYEQYDRDELNRYYDRNRASQRDTSPGGWELGDYGAEDERRDERGFYEEPVYGSPARPRGQFGPFERSRDDQFERADRYRPSWQEPRWQESRDRERDRAQRERGYASGISGQYWTREPGKQDAWSREPSRREQVMRPESRAVGIGGLQQGGFSTFAGMDYDPWESRHLDRSRYDRAESGHASGSSVNHYGRGPKGYARTDERIREDASERLYADSHVDASEISVTVQNGEVTLSGSVENRRQKHRAENIVDAVPGVKDVHNQLRVTRPGVMDQIAEKVQQGVDRLTGHEPRRDTGPGQPASPNNRNAS